MNRSTTDNAGGAENRRKGAAARIRGIVTGLAFFAAGIALSGWWFTRSPARGPETPGSAGPPALSEATKVAVDSEARPAPSADPATLAAVKRLIPNIDSVSVEEGREALRQASFDEFKKAVEEMQARVKEAEGRFLQAQTDQSEAGQEAARKEIQQIQADHLANLRRLTVASQAQMNALQQIKGAAH